MLRLNIGCGPHKRSGWVDVDINPAFEPDVVASITDLPYEDGTVDLLYAGHCLEHLSLQNDVGDGRSTFTAAMEEVRRVLVPVVGAAGFVCPDVYRAIDWYRHGKAEWSLVDACLEGPDDGVDPSVAWDGCFHAWNCHEARLAELVRKTFPEAVAVPMDSAELDLFPIVSNVGWQCAVLTTPTH